MSFSVKGEEFFTTASLGISIYPSDGKISSELLREADRAMYFAKSTGRNNYKFTSHLSDEITKNVFLLET